jgi:DNA topoisomerase-3
MVMTSVLGHISTLDFGAEYSNWQEVSLETLFRAPLISVLGKDMSGVAENLRKEAKRADWLVIWTDCDREGEYIGWEVSEICCQSNRRLKVFRARYSAMTSQTIRGSMNALGPLDMGLVEAAQTRSELDLRSGAVFTRFLTLNIRNWLPEIDRRVVSYGTCQFPTLGFVVEKFKKTLDFKNDTYWTLSLTIFDE